ncbi:MAG: hypothetical protein ACYTGZ_22505 [Planctomycetota bacterium]|jgi:HlyD family secretion protein
MGALFTVRDATKVYRMGDVEVRVILDQRANVLLAPEGALFRTAGAWHVLRVANGRVERCTVETGLRDGRQREITGGLSDGDVIVVHPDATLDTGARVDPTR